MLIRAQLLMWANGLITYGRRAFLPTNECRVHKPLEARTRTLTLFDLSPAFLILGFGLSLSTFCFAMEILSKYIFVFAWSRIRHNLKLAHQYLMTTRKTRCWDELVEIFGFGSWHGDRQTSLFRIGFYIGSYIQFILLLITIIIEIQVHLYSRVGLSLHEI